ncbi:c-type cytochrome [Gelidibacter pelagius]|uniref:Cytochrome c n=1 Tax=Gelidibacter pelagius TaxID=2819985 RepID=A0ABS3SSW1_9FLAO|nr:cytochrome c [Gelidibacter pelagius]MBO3098807.1 cytochrome c [Gelidibacter pelagius]
MKKTLTIFTVLSVMLFMGCGDGEKKKDDPYAKPAPTEQTKAVSSVPASQRVDLTNKGIGPIKNVELGETIDMEMAAKGEEVYNMNCTACHKVDKKFIGPAPKGILERRTPEWVMNMILNPEEMTKDDPLAHDLLLEFNGSPMANQHMTEEQARQMVEYFRTL